MADGMSSSSTGMSLQAKLMAGLFIGSVISGVLGLFYVGYSQLSTPPSAYDDELERRLAATGVLSDDEVEDEPVEDEPMNDAEQALLAFNIPRHEYYLFPLPFISNLKDSKKLVTLELAVSTYAPSGISETFIVGLMDLDPALRSAVLGHLLTKRADELETAAGRQELKSELRDVLNEVVTRDQTDEEAPKITEVHIQKLIVG